MALSSIFACLRENFSSPEDFHLQIKQLFQQHLPTRGSRFHLDEIDYCLYIQRSKNANVVVYQSQYNSVSNGDQSSTQNEREGSSSAISGSKHSKKGLKNGSNENTGGEFTFQSSEALHPLWIKLEPEHVERRRQRGETDDHCELSYIEKKIAYGCSSEKISFSDFCNSFLESCLEKDGKDKKKKKSAGTKYTPEEEAEARKWWSLLEPHQVKFVAASSVPIVLILCHDDTSQDSSRLPVLLTILNEKIVCVLDHLYVSSIEPKHFYELPKVEYIDFFGYSLVSDENAKSEEKKKEDEVEAEDAPTQVGKGGILKAGTLVEERRKK